MSRPSPGILFVDDEELVRSSLGRLVHVSDTPAYFADGPEAAFRMLKQHQSIGVVVSDFSMPGMNGIEFLSAVAKAHPGVVRVLLTAHAEPEVMASAINDGSVFRYLVKPWNDEELLAVLDKAMEQHVMCRENRRLNILTRRKNRQLQSLNEKLEAMVAERTRHLDEANSSLRQASLGVVRLLASATDSLRDEAASSHGEETARLAVGLARRLRLPPKEMDDVRMASMLLDIGCIGMHPRLFDGTAELDEAEKALAQTHPERAAGLLEPLPYSRGVIAAVRHHHERWSGQGFPAALEGEEIPLIARIVGLADDYASMIDGSGRGDKLSPQEAQAELIRGAGRVHDPDLVAAFMTFLTNESAASSRDVRESIRVSA